MDAIPAARIRQVGQGRQERAERYQSAVLLAGVRSSIRSAVRMRQDIARALAGRVSGATDDEPC
jgi:hypothetical protein